MSDVAILQLASSVGLLVEDEKGHPALVRTRLKRALQ